jgi:hypothetical protein
MEKDNRSWEQLLSFEKTYFYDDDSIESTGKGMEGGDLGKVGKKKSPSMTSKNGKKSDMTRRGKKVKSTKGEKKGKDFPKAPISTKGGEKGVNISKIPKSIQGGKKSSLNKMSPSHDISVVSLTPSVSAEPSFSHLPSCTPHPSREPTRTSQPTVTQNPSEIPTTSKIPSHFHSSEPSLGNPSSVDTSPIYLTGDDRPSQPQGN